MIMINMFDSLSLDGRSRNQNDFSVKFDVGKVEKGGKTFWVEFIRDYNFWYEVNELDQFTGQISCLFLGYSQNFVS